MRDTFIDRSVRSMSNQKKLVLIDGNSVLYRAFFALPLLSNDKGVYTNAVFGFTKMLLNILENEQPTHLLVAFDAGKTTFRHETYKEYKGGRQKTPPELSEQFAIVRELLDAFSIKHYELDQYEADDIIGTLSKQAETKGIDVRVITGDKDMLQLVSEKTFVQLTKKGISETAVYSPEALTEAYQLNPDQIIDMKALMGDASDNIPGVQGVGEKTAIKLLKQFETLTNLYDHLDEVSGEKLREKLTRDKENAFMSQKLVTINRASPVTIDITESRFNGYENNQVHQLFKTLGFQSLLSSVATDEVVEQEPLKQMEVILPHAFNDVDLTNKMSLVVDFLTEQYHTDALLGIGISNGEQTYYLTKEQVMTDEGFKAWAADETKKKVTFDAKKVWVALKRLDIEIKGISFDLLLASYLVNPSDNSHDIPAIGSRFNYNDVHYDEEVYGKGKKLTAPAQEQLAEHIARKAKAVHVLEIPVTKALKENQQEELFNTLELPLSLILAEMEATGVKVDQAKLEEMQKDLAGRIAELETDIYEIAGETFNLNSPKQLGVVLFENLELPVIKKTKTGYSTAADVLEQLKNKHPVIEKILLYRQLQKLQSTYLEGLLKVIHADGKIHTRFNQALTQTGRLSSTDPNLQNIPIRLEEGRKIRKAFVPSEPGWKIFACDYSQVELRVLAHIAKDEKLTQAFKDGRDIHTQTAMDVFHVEEGEVDSLMRRQAKAVNFGIVYGISDYGLSQNLGITRKEAKAFIERYFTSYPGVKQYMDDIVTEAKQQGYVTTLMQRRRYLPDITSRNFNQRSFAERTAMNTPIQGSAADIIKKAMIDLNQALKEERLSARALLQVHDELIIEAPEEEIKRLKVLVPKVMEHTVALDVPLKVDYAHGNTWYDAK